MRAGREELIEEAARMVCDEGFADYSAARRKAAHRIGAPRLAHSVDNKQIEARVLQRQELFGGEDYRRHLRTMRQEGLRVMQLLAAHSPQLAGSAVTGAIGLDHRVQVHVISEPAESVELNLINARIPFEQGERTYRMADGQEERVPLLHLQGDGVDVDVAIFSEHSRRVPPLSQVDGKPARRLKPDELRALLEASAPED